MDLDEWCLSCGIRIDSSESRVYCSEQCQKLDKAKTDLPESSTGHVATRIESEHDDPPYKLPPSLYSSDKSRRSYAALIGQAILASPERRLTLQEIYDWVSIAYPYFEEQSPTIWMNSLRRTLSTDGCFRTVPRDSSRGRTLWTIYDEDLDCFKDSGYRRHTKNRSFVGSTQYTSRVSDIYALACTIYEVYTGRPPSPSTHAAVVTILRLAEKGERIDPPQREWTSEEESIWWLVHVCWKENIRRKPEADLVENILKDISLFPDLRPPPHLSAIENVKDLNAANDRALSPLSKCIQWVVDVDAMQSRHRATFESMSPDPRNISVGADDQESDPQSLPKIPAAPVLSLANSITAKNDPPQLQYADGSELNPRTLPQIPPAPVLSLANSITNKDNLSKLRRRGSTSGSIETSLSEGTRDSESCESTPESMGGNLQDPTLHSNWRARITRLGDRPFDLEYGSLSYLVSSRRKFMTGSTASGSSRAAWRNDCISVSSG